MKRLIIGLLVLLSIMTTDTALASIQVTNNTAPTAEELAAITTSVAQVQDAGLLSNASVSSVASVVQGNDRTYIFLVNGTDSDGAITYIICTDKLGSRDIIVDACKYTQDDPTYS